jgi:hypothetical protein
MRAAAAVLPTIEQLDQFLCSLRLARFKIGPDQLAGAQKILLLALGEADHGLAAARLKTLLAPIVARSPTQQADFYRRFEALMAEIAPVPARMWVEPDTHRARDAGAAPTASPSPRHRLVAMAGAAAALLAIAAGLRADSQPPAPPPLPQIEAKGFSVPTVATEIKPVEFITATLFRRAGYQAASAALTTLPLLFFGGWMVWRWRRRVLWLERHLGVRDADPAVVRLRAQHQPLFPAAALSAIALDLRRHFRVPSRDLDIDRTISETLDAGGSFTPVWRTVPRSPSYLFLIERESAHDHVAGILDRAVDRLAGELVAVERYHFRGDPRWLLAAGGDRGIEPIADVAARHGDHRLVVLAGGDGFFEPLTDRLEPGVEQALAQWTPRAVLSTKPMRSWSGRELALVFEAGFDLATASRSGLEALARRAAAEPDRSAELLEGVVVSTPSHPSRVSGEPRPSSARAPRPGARSALLIHAGGGAQAEADTARLAQMLEACNFNVRLLRDPNRRTAIDFIELLIRTTVEPEDMILIHFHGRFAAGGSGAIFLGSGEGLDMPAFAELLSRSGAGHQVLILDGVIYDGVLFQDSDSSAVPQGLAWDASSPSSTRTLEVVWARAGPKSADENESAMTLTGLVVDTIEQDLWQLVGETTFREIVDRMRQRAARLGILDRLNLNYFSSAPTSAVLAVPPRPTADAGISPGGVFLSYAREDQAAASRLYEFLKQEGGIDVWLGTGEDWAEASRRQIEKCSFFMPLISTEAVRRQDGLFRRQWAWAIDRARSLEDSTPFIVPVVIDDTPVDIDGIPKEFRRVPWTLLRGGVGDDAFRSRMRALVADTVSGSGFSPRLAGRPPGLTGEEAAAERQGLRTALDRVRAELQQVQHDIDTQLTRARDTARTAAQEAGTNLVQAAAEADRAALVRALRRAQTQLAAAERDLAAATDRRDGLTQMRDVLTLHLGPAAPGAGASPPASAKVEVEDPTYDATSRRPPWTS